MRDEHLNEGISTMCLLASAAPVLLTASTVQTELAKVVIPAKLVGPHTGFRIASLLSVNNNANAKNFYHLVNGVQVTATPNLTSKAFASLLVMGYMRGDLVNQCWNTAPDSPFVTGSGAIRTSAIDFSTDVEFTFAATLTNAADQLTLEAFTFELINPAPR